MPPYRKMGWHASDTHELVFDDCRVPEDQLLGERGEGFKTFLRILDDGRIAISALAVGLAQACLDASVEHARTRHAFGGPIGRYQSIAFKCADMARRGRERAQPRRTRRRGCASRGGRSAAPRRWRSSTRARSPSSATREAVQIHGGYGFIDETPVSPLLPRREDPRDRRGHERDPAPADRPRPRPPGRVARPSGNMRAA